MEMEQRQSSRVGRKMRKPHKERRAKRPQPKMSGHVITNIYRGTTMGIALEASLEELLRDEKIPGSLANKILLQFDRHMHFALAHRAKPKYLFKAGKLHTYKYIDDVWTFVLDDVEFRETHWVERIDRLKVVASIGKNNTGGPAGISVVD